MKKIINKDFWQEVSSFTAFLFATELIFRVVSLYPIMDWATLRIFISCFFAGLFFTFIFSSMKKKKIREKFYAFILFIFAMYSWAQAGLRNFLGVYMSMGTSGQVGAVLTYIKEFLMSYKLEYYAILIPLFIYLCYIRLPKKYAHNHRSKMNVKSNLFGVGCMVVMASIYLSTIYLPFMQNEIQLVSNATLFFNASNPTVAVSEFGTSMFGMMDLKQLLLPSSTYAATFSVADHVITDMSRNIDDTDWQTLTDNETDANYKLLNQYFLSQSITDKNDYTGYFKNKNVIVIMMESANNAILDSKYFPNFSKMLEHSWFWENNYSPRNACATGDNEFSGMTSLYPLGTSCTVNVYPNNTYYESLFNVFKNVGYTTSSYHDYDDSYYLRNVFHYNMGSMHYYDADALGIYKYPGIYKEWPSDVELMDKSAEYYTSDSPFMVWMTTVSPHQPYELDSELGDKYYDLFADTSYTPEVKRYLSKLKVTDDALGELMNILEEKGILDDTVIVLYGDHYPYGLQASDVQSMVSYDVNDFKNIEHTPFVIYNSELEPQTFTDNTFYMNVLPTLANLFDLDYDPRLYMGEDIFSDTYSNRVVFADSSWQDSIARYNASDGSVTYLGDETYTTEDLQRINNEIYQKKQMSKLAIENNYFSYLDQNLHKEESEETSNE